MLSLSFSKHSGVIEYGINFGGGPLGTNTYELGGRFWDGFKKSPITRIEAPLTNENSPTDSLYYETDYCSRLRSQLTGGFIGFYGIFNIPSPWKKLKPVVQLDITQIWLKDNFNARFEAENNNTRFYYNGIYNFSSLGIGFRAGIEYDFGDIYFIKLCIGQSFYIPRNTFGDSKSTGEKYRGLSTYEQSQNEIRIAFGFKLLPEKY